MSADLQVLPAWQPNICNGQQKAFMFYMLAVRIFVVKLDCDLRNG
ncbi:hypothetical protein [Mesorhizobium delmotii]|nr:hypothetical protein [Mesorhizobium delmotii]